MKKNGHTNNDEAVPLTKDQKLPHVHKLLKFIADLGFCAFFKTQKKKDGLVRDEEFLKYGETINALTFDEGVRWLKRRIEIRHEKLQKHRGNNKFLEIFEEFLQVFSSAHTQETEVKELWKKIDKIIDQCVKKPATAPSSG